MTKIEDGSPVYRSNCGSISELVVTKYEYAVRMNKDSIEYVFSKIPVFSE